MGENSYSIHIGSGGLCRAGEFFKLNRRVLIVTDDGVPAEYAKRVSELCAEPYTVTVKQGEGSKTLETFGMLLRTMMEKGFGRADCVIAVGGGMVGDLAGFAAASYMRGVDFYNIPTTVLSTVDSSVGGKTAVNLDGVKNIVGAFKQPRGVLIDPELTKSLPQRQISSGLAEALKMAMTFDRELFELFEREDPMGQLEQIIARSLEIKISVVQEDEKESGIRRVLNFGHTVGHGIESLGLGLYHGECVALGMIPMCSDSVRERLIPILEALTLPTRLDFDRNAAYSALTHDKKAGGRGITCILCEDIGEYSQKELTLPELKELINKM